MNKETEQMKCWAGIFGKEYTDRNTRDVEQFDAYHRQMYGVAREEMNGKFLGNMDRNMRILEVGSNIGNQLLCLQRMGFTNLYGIELQQSAVEISKTRTQGIQLIQGTAFDIPFKDAFFDMIFTSGVLIHISPKDLPDALKEIYRCSRCYIYGFEYWASELTNVNYRGHEELLWKGDYSAEYRRLFPDLVLVKEEKFREISETQKINIDAMFLLKKGS